MDEKARKKLMIRIMQDWMKSGKIPVNNDDYGVSKEDFDDVILFMKTENYFQSCCGTH